MSNIRKNLIYAALTRAHLSIDHNTHNGFHKEYEFSKRIDGRYKEWDSKVQQLIRRGTHKVILKELKNVANASQSWFEEAKSHLTIKEEQKAFYISRSYDFSISSNSSNLGKSSNQYTSISSKDNDSEESPRLSKKLKIDNVDIQNDYEREFMQQRSNIGTNDEVQNNSSLHSEQDKPEILDDEL
ncbi:kinase-like domain-containing protein [Rhizophagus irregularis DAOM 181602=DAOM 197198]|nr:kinase-like domain-containing protein [Rhizophagus irregularis DAOM 181602=DAOM 197198]